MKAFPVDFEHPRLSVLIVSTKLNKEGRDDFNHYLDEQLVTLKEQLEEKFSQENSSPF